GPCQEPKNTHVFESFIAQLRSFLTHLQSQPITKASPAPIPRPLTKKERILWLCVLSSISAILIVIAIEPILQQRKKERAALEAAAASSAQDQLQQQATTTKSDQEYLALIEEQAQNQREENARVAAIAKQSADREHKRRFAPE